MIFIILGISGCGKGTQAEILAQHFGLAHLSTGELFRRELALKTLLGVEAHEKWWGKGLWVPTENTWRLLEPEVEKHLVPGFVLEGWPRTVGQARFLDDYLVRKGVKVDKVFLLETSEATAVRRLRGRVDQAQKAGERVRPDETREEVVRQRLRSYQETTALILKYYRERGILELINNEKDINEVSQEILGKLESGALT